ncbi:MAG: NPCBM/NEW2 domain-containing protein [Planctomycetota bacterium]|nr:NPCBM/NEW2 domain-containing protein [Planctomycetota bacterium]
MRVVFLVILLIAIAAPLTEAQTPGEIRVEPIVGETMTAATLTYDPEAALVEYHRAGTDDVERIGLDRLQRIVFAQKPASSSGQAPVLWLRSGQELSGSVAAVAAGLEITWPFAAGPMLVPWRYVESVRLMSDQTLPGAVGFDQRREVSSGTADLLYYVNEGKVKRLSVQFLGAEEGAIRVAYRGREQAMPIGRVYGLIFAEQTGAPPKRQPNPKVRFEMAGGVTVEGQLLALDGSSCALRLAEGSVFKAPRSELVAMQVFSDRLVWLPDMNPRIEQTPALDRIWPPLVDRGPGSQPIRLGGESYSRGYVIVPKSRLDHDLGGRFDIFEAVIGMEEGAGEKAHAVFRVIADGKTLFESDPFTRTTEPKPIRIDVSGVRSLVLEADFGANFDLGDLCVFASPRVLKR